VSGNDSEPIDIGKPFDLRWMDDYNRLSAAYEGESDRAAALLAASFLDEQLKQALESVLVDDSKLIKKLFEGYGPLSGFSARIDIAYAMGYLPRIIHRELHLIREIRNHFAHHPDLTDFATQTVKDKCAELRIPKELVTDKSAVLDARTQFLWASSHCVSHIRLGWQFIVRPKVPPDR
jgi:DNA-binding MltR family transcriptional regulator